jgi:hypothetical protein
VRTFTRKGVRYGLVLSRGGRWGEPKVHVAQLNRQSQGWEPLCMPPNGIGYGYREPDDDCAAAICTKCDNKISIPPQRKATITMPYKEDMDKEYAPSWKSQPGDEIEGVVMGISRREFPAGWNKPAGTTYPILTVNRAVNTGTELDTAELTGDERAVHCMVKVLEEWVRDDQPRVGDYIIVRDDGKKKSGAGFTYQAMAKTIVRYETLPDNLKRSGTQPSPAVAPPFVQAKTQPVEAAPAPAADTSKDVPW